MADYTDLDPTVLRPSVSDGTNLKPSITTSGYSGGTPAAATDLKRSICYADGTLKESIADAVGVKASWLLAGSARPPNVVPVASSVAFTGTETVGETLTRTYSYSDADGDAEGASTTQWYRADNGSGLNEAAIAGATSSTYTLVSADEGKFIRVGVTPVAATGKSPGVEAFSSYSGAIATAGLTEVATTTVSGGAVSSVSITVNLVAGKSYRYGYVVERAAGTTAVTQEINDDATTSNYDRGNGASGGTLADSNALLSDDPSGAGAIAAGFGAAGLLSATPYAMRLSITEASSNRSQFGGQINTNETTHATITLQGGSSEIADGTILTCWRLD